MKEFKVSKKFNIKPSGDSDESKTWKLELTIPKDITMRDLAIAVLKSEVVKVQNGNRKKFYDIPDGHIFRKVFNKSGVQTDPEEEFIAKISEMTPQERIEYINELEKKAAGINK